jgi:predicted RNA polymerase sigma factor
MGFFSSFFGWFKSLFSLVAETAIGIAADSIKESAIAVVKNLENKPDLNGTEKYNTAKDVLVKKYPSMQEAAINLAIEAAVAIVKDKMDD